MPNTAESIAILRRRFGGLGQSQPAAMQDLPADQGYYGDPTGSIELAGLRQGRQGELTDRMAADLGVGDIGDLRRANFMRQDLNRDIADDPFTGEAEQKRIGGIQSALDTVNTFMRPETMGARRTAADEAAYGGGALEGAKVGAGEAAKMKVGASPDAQYIANEQLRRQRELKQTPSPVPGQFPFPPEGGVGAAGDTGGMPPNMKPLDANSQRAITALREGAPLIGELEQILGAPGAQKGNAFSNHMAYRLYQFGASPDTIQMIPGVSSNAQKRIQVAGLLKVLGAAPYAVGSRSFQFLKQAQEHLTNPAASDEFISSQLQELKKLWPRMQQEIIRAHTSPGAALNFTPPGGGADEGISDPNWGR